MKDRHVFFGEESAERQEERQKLMESSMPEAFKIRQKKIERLKVDFLRRAQALKLGIKYSTEYLVLQVFELRLEEGLKELLDRHTTYEKIGNDYIFSYIDQLESAKEKIEPDKLLG